MAAKKIETADVRWYVVHSNSGGEWLAAKSLKDVGYEVFCPWAWNVVRHARKAQSVRRPYFPRYLFLGAEDGHGLYDANTALGVSTVLYDSSGPLVLPEAVINELRSKFDDEGKLNDGSIEERKVQVFDKGSSVTVMKGPFAGFGATVALDEGGSVVWITIEIFGRDAKIPVRPETLRARATMAVVR